MRGRKPNMPTAIDPICNVPPIPPPWLSDSGREQWDKLIPYLVDCGYATALDSVVLGIYVENCALLALASTEIQREGAVTQTPSNHDAINKWLKIARYAEERILKIAGEYGLTALSRVRLPNATGAVSDSGLPTL